MVVKYQMSTDATRLEDIIVKIWEAQSDMPGAEVWEQTYVEKDGAGVPTPGAGHNVIETIIANGLDKVVHIVRAIGAVSGDVIHKYNAEPKTDVVNLFDPIQFKIGDGGEFTPVADTTTYINAILEGVQKYMILRNNYGFLFLDTHYTRDVNAGAWDLIPDDKFNDGDEFTIIMQPTAVTTVVNDSVVAKYFAGFVDVAANTDYVNAHLRKLIRLSGTVAYTFTALGDQPPIGYGFCFSTFGNAGVATINFLNGQLKWGAVPKSSIELQQYCDACFTWDGTFWNVVWLVKSDFINGVTIPAGTILGTGTYNQGDLPPGDPILTVVHNLDITGDYNVLFSLRSTNLTFGKNNKMPTPTFWHDPTTATKKNRFYFSMQEITGEVQDLVIYWVIIKA